MSDLQIAIKIIKRTNNLLAKRFRAFGGQVANLKKHEEIVTKADLEANKIITRELLKHFPEDNIVSEEAPTIKNPGENTWYIDPLDGTTNFCYGFRLFATCLARTDDKDEVNLGVVGLPNDKEIFWTSAGHGAYLNGRRIQVAKPNKHRRRGMFLFCGGHSDAAQKKTAQIMRRIEPHNMRFRCLSSAGIEFSAVASGRADGCILTEVQPWDVLAGVLLVRAAGGKVTNFSGKDWRPGHNSIIASNGHSHRKLLNLVK